MIRLGGDEVADLEVHGAFYFKDGVDTFPDFRIELFGLRLVFT